MNNIDKQNVIEIYKAEGVYSPKIDHLFADFSEEKFEELSVEQNINVPFNFKPKEMDLKKL